MSVERWLLVLMMLACGLLPLHAARADAPLDVSKRLPGVALGQRAWLLEDRTGALRIEQVIAAETSARFVRSTVDVPSLGFTSSTYWLRLAVSNPSVRVRAWLLELGFPLLDDVTLYVQREDGGFEAHETGAMRPFSQRDIAYRDFVFSLEEPAQHARTYYLRVVSSSPIRLPLVGWTMREFLEHQQVDWSALCIFYGVLLVMICYTACIYVVAKQRDYAPYVAYVVFLAATQFTLSGHTFQFLLPNDPWLVHRLLPAFAATTMFFGTLVVQTYLPRTHPLTFLARSVAAYCALLAVLSFVLPHPLVVRVSNGTVVAVMLLAIVYGIELVRVEGRRARLFVLGWGSVIVGALVSALQTAGLLPQMFVVDWSLQIGGTLQLVLLSSALADKLASARTELSHAHEHLSLKLTDLSAALLRAEHATQRAERATQLKDDFLATMSHEFRTPLNPIINIPQEIRLEFVQTKNAACSSCGECFELDEGELLSETTACPECARPGTLIAKAAMRYTGEPLRTRHFLSRVERSGMHLLHVVNGILDFSKLQAGHIELVREAFDASMLVRNTVLERHEQAQKRELGITCMIRPPSCLLDADPARLRQVLLILLDNAIQYSDRAGFITVRAELLDGVYTVSVTDEGIGIAKEHLESIFFSFEQVSKGNTRKYGGTGLGLSIARSLSRMQGGDLTVESTPGSGSTFTVTVPRRVAFAQRSVAAKVSAAAPLGAVE